MMNLDQDLLERWMAGQPMAEIGFAFYEPVVVTEGPFTGSIGTVVSLVALEPEPLYTVELDRGRGDIHLAESALAAA